MPESSPSVLRLELPRSGVDGQLFTFLIAGLGFAAMGGAFTWIMLFGPLSDVPRYIRVFFLCFLCIPSTLQGILWILLGIFRLLNAITRTTLIVSDGKWKKGVERGGGLTIISSTLGLKRQRHFDHATIRDLRLDPGPDNNPRILVRLTTGKDKIILNRRGTQEKEMTRLVESLRASLWPNQSLTPSTPHPFTYTTENQNIRIHMGPEPVTRIFNGLYYVALPFALGMPPIGIITFVLLYLEPQSSGTFGLLHKIITSCFFVLFTIVFSIVGIVLCKWTRRIASQQADFILTPKTLNITTSDSPPQQLSWPRDQIAAITNASIGNTVQLHIRLHSGETFSLFKHRSLANLRWLAETLQTILTLPTPEETRAAFIQAVTPLHAATPAGQPDPFTAELLAAIDEKLKGSNIHRISDETSKKIILQVAPLGGWKRAINLIPIFIFFPVFAIMFSCAGFASLLGENSDGSRDSIIFPIVFFTFALILLTTIFFVTRRARRRARLTARIEIPAPTSTTDKNLTITTDTPPHETLHIPHAAITAINICVLRQGQNHSLQFILKDGSTRAALNFLSKNELDLLASALRLTINLS